MYCTTVLTRSIGPHAMALELPLLVGSALFSSFSLKLWLRGPVFARPPNPREGISDDLARGSIIRVLTVSKLISYGMAEE